MSIICGTDLSAASASALDVAIALAGLSGQREVLLVHVASPELGGVREPALEDARARLDEQAQRVQPPHGPAVRTKLIAGAADEALVELAEAEGAALIVIAARSTSSSLLRLGTTTEKVIARSSVPVLVVRDPAPWLEFAAGKRPLRALLGVDDTVTCDLGIAWTHALAGRGAVEVVLGAIYYPDDAAAHYGLDLRGMVDADPAIERLIARDLLTRFTGPAASITARPRRGLGRIGDHLVELARDEKVDAIVVGTGQKTGLPRLGSVSSVVVNDATQSVICVPPNAHVAAQTIPALRSALVATDLSAFANRAIPYGFAVVAGAADAEVHLVHVLAPDAEADEGAVAHQLYGLAPPHIKARVRAHVVRGEDAAVALAQCAARLGVDAICIASHGRSGITRALVGSVADRLLRATRRPVLVLRPA